MTSHGDKSWESASKKTVNDVVKDSEIEKVLRFLYGRKDVSPVELRKFFFREFGDIKSDDEGIYGITYERAEENTRIFLQFENEKTTDIILKLLNEGLIYVEEACELVWAVDGEVSLQPPGSKIRGKDTGGKVFAFLLNVTEKGEELLILIHGNRKELDEAARKISILL